MLDIHSLQVFCEAAQLGSFTAAARTLNMSQPAVSMQIKTLEFQLQVKLFERNGRSMQLTKAGQALIPRAQQLIEMAMSTEEFIRTANHEVLGDLIIGNSVPSANHILIPIVAWFQQLYPHVKIRIPAVSGEELVDKVNNGQYDFGIMNVIDRCDPYECIPFFDDQIILIAPLKHEFSQRLEVSPHDLPGQRFVCQGAGSACRYAVRDALRPFGVDIAQFDVRMEISSPEAIITAVQHGIGLAFISRIEAAEAIERGEIRHIKITGTQLKTSVEMAFSVTHAASLAGLKFKAYLMHSRTRTEIERMVHPRFSDEVMEQQHA